MVVVTRASGEEGRPEVQSEETMRFKRFVCTIAVTLFAAGMVPTRLSAQEAGEGKNHPRYQLVDLGTFGGPHSAVGGQSIVVNNKRVVAGGADTSIPDPYAPLCFDPGWCFVEHTFRWQDGALADLGALPGGYSSFGYAMNEPGLIVGWSQNGLIDPITGVPEYVPTAWRKGHIIDLGTFGGAFGEAAAVNDQGFVVGAAENSTPDPFGLASFFAIDGSTELHAFGWKGSGAIFDLGTLSGPGAVPLSVNKCGQVVGLSFTSSIPGPLGIPPLDPFLWENGVMVDLGTLGGTLGIAAKVTNQGQVVGDSDLEGDSTQHGFSWKQGVLTDLGTFGGTFSTAKWVNESGEVVGGAKTANDDFVKAFRWKNGRMRDLGTVDGDLCSVAWSINETGQIVGNSAPNCDFFAEERAFLWEKGRIIDLNAFVPPDSDLYLLEADFINDNGDITGPAFLSNGDVHQYLLLRCGQQDSGGCQTARAPLAHRARNINATASRQGRMSSPSTGLQGLRNRISRIGAGVKR